MEEQKKTDESEKKRSQSVWNEELLLLLLFTAVVKGLCKQAPWTCVEKKNTSCSMMSHEVA